MNLKRAISRTIAEIVSLGPSRPLGHRALMYHAVGTHVANDPHGLFSISPELFEEHLQFLARDFKERILPFERAPNSDAPYRISLTFDDGYRDNFETAFPLLTRYQIPFTIFVTTGFVSQGRENFLTPRQILELAKSPLTSFGTHGVTHTCLTRCSDEELREELTRSKRDLEDWLGRPVNALSYPHGGAGKRVREAAARAGYQLAATSYFGANTEGRDPLLLLRTEITGLDSVRVLDQKIRGHWDWYRFRQKDPAELP